jgi:hypothetical protein
LQRAVVAAGPIEVVICNAGACEPGALYHVGIRAPTSPFTGLDKAVFKGSHASAI